MSSNIRITKFCEYCGNEFEAKTTVTKYCGLACNRKAYKANKRDGKINATNEATKKTMNMDIEKIKAKEFLTVADVAKLLNCSKVTIYNWINSGKIEAVNLAERKTLVRRSSIDQLFE